MMTTLMIMTMPMMNKTTILITLSSFTLMMMLKYPHTHFTLTSAFINDSTSTNLIILSLFITTLITSSTKSKKTIILLMLINLSLITAFMSSSTLNFYIFFELSIIPTFLLISTKGKQPERMQASIYMLMYTIFASLPLLMMILMLPQPTSIMMMITIKHQVNMPLLFILAFLTKLPMFSLHLWLPKAHVEAPMEGSMILAAVLLKLGGYGLLRFLPLMEKFHKYTSPWMISLSLVGAISTAMSCNRHKDMKAIIAYSSVAHMALVITSLFSLSTISQTATMSMMISHGLCSSGLFMLTNESYKKFHSRNLFLFKGFQSTSPTYTLWWFLLLMANMGTPPFLTLLSEILAMTSMMKWSLITSIPTILSNMFIASFCVIMFSMINHNSPSPKMMNPMKTSNSLTLMMHLTPLLTIITNPTMLL